MSAALRFLLVSLAFVTTATAADFSQQFDAANRLYEQGKFSEAAAEYQSIIESGSASAAIYFNLGNAWFKSGEAGRAIAAYRTAARLAPRDPDLRANLRFARSQVQGPTLPPAGPEQWLKRLTVNEWALLAASAFWIFLLALAVTQILPNWKSSLRAVAIASGALTVVTAACLWAAAASQSEPQAIVIADETTVHNGPLEESPAAFVVHDGAELEVLDQKDDWLQVSSGGQRAGWLRKDQVVLSGSL